MKSTKPTLNEAENGNKSKPLLANRCDFVPYGEVENRCKKCGYITWVDKNKTFDEIAKEYGQIQHDHYIIDIGTGSGCIPIAIKKNMPALNITAIDISLDALAIAKQNAITHATTIEFKQLDFLNDAASATLDKYDVIISNPPYITEKQHDTMDKNVTAYEPHLALFVKDEQALIFYEKIVVFALTHLNENGMIFLETHEELAKEVAGLFDDKLYEVAIKKDIFEKERMVIVTRYR